MRAAVVMRVPFRENDIQAGLVGIANQHCRGGAAVGRFHPLDLIGGGEPQRLWIEIRVSVSEPWLIPAEQRWSSPGPPVQHSTAFWNGT